MNTTDTTHELTYDLIRRAVNGEPTAMEEILRYYEPYHNALCTYEKVDTNGVIHSEVDEDMKIQVQAKLLDAIQKNWRELI